MKTLSDFLRAQGNALRALLPPTHSPAVRAFLDPDALASSPSLFSPDLEVLVRHGFRQIRQDTTLSEYERTELQLALVTRAFRAQQELESESGEGVVPPSPNAAQTEFSQEVIDFLNRLMHDLRSPLVTVRGYLDMLTRGDLGALTTVQERTMKVALRNSIALDDQMEIVLEYARAQQGRLSIMPRATHLATLLPRCLRGLEELAERKKLTVHVPEQPELLPAVHIDGKKITRALRILLDNAIKFTPQGSIHLELQHRDDTIEVAVRDTGCGIDAARLLDIFTPFFHFVPEPIQARGLGLGLSVARYLVEAHGSALHVESEPNEGSRFWFSLAVA